MEQSLVPVAYVLFPGNPSAVSKQAIALTPVVVANKFDARHKAGAPTLKGPKALRQAVACTCGSGAPNASRLEHASGSRVMHLPLRLVWRHAAMRAPADGTRRLCKRQSRVLPTA